jgi:hypothetical protein
MLGDDHRLTELCTDVVGPRTADAHDEVVEPDSGWELRSCHASTLG